MENSEENESVNHFRHLKPGQGRGKGLQFRKKSIVDRHKNPKSQAKETQNSSSYSK